LPLRLQGRRAHWPLIGTLATGAGTLYIERASRRDAMRVVHHMAEALRSGDILAIFPEGTTGDGISLLPFHANLMQAAISAESRSSRWRCASWTTSGDTSWRRATSATRALVGSFWRTLCAPGVTAVVSFGEPQRADGRDRRAWASDLHATVDALRIHGPHTPPGHS
jgi:1-acyl-sn-glycerol-3-phosphate acyltransferase